MSGQEPYEDKYPKREKGKRGGSRARRRRLAVDRKIESGELTAENIVPSHSLKHFELAVWSDELGGVVQVDVPSPTASDEERNWEYSQPVKQEPSSSSGQRPASRSKSRHRERVDRGESEEEARKSPTRSRSRGRGVGSAAPRTIDFLR